MLGSGLLWDDQGWGVEVKAFPSWKAADPGMKLVYLAAGVYVAWWFLPQELKDKILGRAA